MGHEAIRDSGVRLFVHSTGAGAGIQDGLWNTPGMSAVLIGCQFPYDPKEIYDFVGFKLDRFVCLDTAIEQASASYMRAKAVAGNQPAVGLGITAAVASNRPVRSGYRVYAAVVGDNGCWGFSSNIVGEDRNLQGEEIDIMGLDLLKVGVFGGKTPFGMTNIMAPHVYETFNERFTPVDISARVEELFWQHPYFLPTGARLKDVDGSMYKVLYPGSFNPLHDGHRAMANTITGSYGHDVVYTINADSPHKPPLTGVQLLARAAQFQNERWAKSPSPVLFTKGQPLFVDKAKAYPNNRWIIGADTIERMLDPKWGSSPEKTLSDLQNLGSYFYAFDRAVKEGDQERQISVRQILLDRGLWSKYHRMFATLPNKWPAISSTEIRNAQGQ